MERGLEHSYLIRVELDKEFALKSGEGYVVRKGNKIITIMNLEYEFNVWSLSQDEAFRKACQKTLGTHGVKGLVVRRKSDTRIRK